MERDFLARQKDSAMQDITLPLFAWLFWALCCWTDLCTTIALRWVNTRCEDDHLAAKLTQLLYQIAEPYFHTRDVAEWTGLHKDSNLWMRGSVRVTRQNASCDCFMLAQSASETFQHEKCIRPSTITCAHGSSTSMHSVCQTPSLFCPRRGFALDNRDFAAIL